MNTPHATRMELDLVLLDAPFEKRDTVLAHVDSCERCRADLVVMREDAASFASTRLVRSSDVVEKRLGVRRARMAWALIPALLGACLMVLWVRPHTGTKGDAVVRFVVGPEGAMHGAVGEAQVRAGDALAFETQGAAGKSLLVISVRAGAPVVVYAPADSATSMHVDADGPLADGIVLDDPGVERVFAIVTDTPITLADVASAASAIADGGESIVRTATKLPIVSHSQSSLLIETAPP